MGEVDIDLIELSCMRQDAIHQTSKMTEMHTTNYFR